MTTDLPIAQQATLADALQEIQRLRDRVSKLEARPYTVAQAAEALGVDPKTVRRRIQAGTLAHTRTGRRVVVHLDRDPVTELLVR